jgi:hypothetical protein
MPLPYGEASASPEDNAMEQAPRGAADQQAGGQSPDECSLALLNENLTATQRAQYAKNQCFEVIGGRSRKRYRIHRGNTFNIVELDANGEPVAKLCFLPRGPLAEADILLAQKMALELFEPDARKVAHQRRIAPLVRSVPHHPNEEQPARGSGPAATSQPAPEPLANNADQTRYARCGDRLLTADFGFLEGGFTTAEEPRVTVRVMNGAELEFENDIEYSKHDGLAQSARRDVLVGMVPGEYPEVIPVLEISSREFVGFHRLTPGQRATVVWAPDPHDALAEISRLIMRR